MENPEQRDIDTSTDSPAEELNAVERFFVDLGLPRQWWISLPIIVVVVGGIWILVNWLMPMLLPSMFAP